MCNEDLISEYPLTSFWTLEGLGWWLYEIASGTTPCHSHQHHQPSFELDRWPGMATDVCFRSPWWPDGCFSIILPYFAHFWGCNMVQPGWLPPVTCSGIECYNGIQWPYKLPAGRCQHQGHMRVWIQTGSPSIIQNMGSLNASKAFNNHLINYHVNPGWINMTKTY